MNYLPKDNKSKMKRDQCAKWIPPLITRNKVYERRADGRLWPCWFPETTYKFTKERHSSSSTLRSSKYAADSEANSPSRSDADLSVKGKCFAGIMKTEKPKKIPPVKSQTPPVSARDTPFTSGYMSLESVQEIFPERNTYKNLKKRRACKQTSQHDESTPTDGDSALGDGLDSNSDNSSDHITCYESASNSKSSEISNLEILYKKSELEKLPSKNNIKTLYMRNTGKKPILRAKTNFRNTKSTETILPILPKMSFVDTHDGEGINIIEIPLDFSDNFPKHKVETPTVENKRISDAPIGLIVPHISQKGINQDHNTERYIHDHDINKVRPSNKKLIEEYKMTWGPPEEKDGTLLDITPITSECQADYLHSPVESVCVNEFVAKLDSFTFHEKATCSHSFLKSPSETIYEKSQQINSKINTKVKYLKVRKWDWDSNINGADNIPAWFLNLIEGHYTKKYKEGKGRKSNKY